MADAHALAGRTSHSEQEVHRIVRAMVLELSPSPDPEAGDDANLVNDLGFHSLALVELAFALEDDFDLPLIDEPTARRITTIGEVKEHVVTALRDRGDLTGVPGSVG